MVQAEFKYVASGGVEKEGTLQLEDYRRAKDLGMSATQYINAKYADADVDGYGTAFQQGQQSLGIYTRDIPELGIRKSTVRDVLDGTASQRIQMAGEGLTGGGGVVAMYISRYT